MSRLAAALVVGLAMLPVCVAQQTGSAGSAGTPAGKSPEKSELKPAVKAPAKKLHEYDVVSIRVNKDGPRSDFGEEFDASTDWGNDRYTARDVTLRGLLEDAYDIKREKISGVPGAMDDVRFDVAAKMLPDSSGKPVKLSGDELTAMLVPVLQERFGLKAHVETRTMPIYEMVVAKGGVKMPLSKEDVKKDLRLTRSSLSEEIVGAKVEMDELSDLLEEVVAHRTVINSTELKSKYDVTLKWGVNDGAGAETKDAGPSVFTAVEEQLGLKLVSTKGPVKVLVVEHVEMPSEN